MKRVELYAQVRRAVYVEGISQREAARRFGIDPRTVAKMLAFSVPPGYRRSRPPARPKLDPFTWINRPILLAHEGRATKRRHTSSLHDTTKLAVARILGDGVRKSTRVFSGLHSHYVCDGRFGRLGEGNDKAK